MPETIYLVAKIAAAVDKVGGKLKADKRNLQDGYNYVSADKILSVCGQELSAQGIAIIPSIVQKSVNVFDRGNGKFRYDATVEFIFKVTDGITSFEEPWCGMGSDYTVPDKALYKAITSGHKYFLSKLFCVGEGNEDSEHDEEREPANVKQLPGAKPAKDTSQQTEAEIMASISHAEPLPPMTREEAAAMTTSTGEAYGTMEAGKLRGMAKAINTKIKGEPLSADDRKAYQRKLQAIGILTESN